MNRCRQQHQFMERIWQPCFRKKCVIPVTSRKLAPFRTKPLCLACLVNKMMAQFILQLDG